MKSKSFADTASELTAELIYGGHISSLGVSGLVLTSLLLLHAPISLALLAIPYLMTQTVYSYNHAREIKYDVRSNPERTLHLQKTFKWASLSPLWYGLMLVAMLCFTNSKVTLFATFLVAGGVLYTDYFKSALTKLIPGFKTFYTALFLALCVFTAPLFQQTPISLFFLSYFLFVFVRLCINTAFFDIKDIKSDGERGLKTIPVLFGARTTLYLLHIANLASLLVLLWSIRAGSLPGEAILLAISVVYDLVYLSLAFFLKGKDLRHLSYAVADAEFLIWPTLILLTRLIA